MKSYSTLKNNITSIAIGGFDGMHLAHQELFKQLDNNGAIIVIHTGYANLSPLKYRQEYSKYPIFYYDLDDIRDYSAKKFINLLQLQYPKLDKIVVGYDFHFGKEAKYSSDDLKKLFKKNVTVVPEISHKGIAVHSRIIRELLKNGDIPLANELLTRAYKIYGTNIKGQGLGSKEFVPTINLNIDNFLLPKEAIYATKTTIDNISYNSISFIGHRVTTDNKFAIETHILDKTITTITNENISIEFYKRIRDNKKFAKFEDLKAQILKDIKDATNYHATIL